MIEFRKSPSAVADKSDFWVAWTPEGAKDAAQETVVLHITEGDGTNLTEEDDAEGYVDYIYYDAYKAVPFLEAMSLAYDEDAAQDLIDDGGMALLKEPYSSLTVESIISRALNLAFGVDAVEQSELRVISWPESDGE